MLDCRDLTTYVLDTLYYCEKLNNFVSYEESNEPHLIISITVKKQKVFFGTCFAGWHYEYYCSIPQYGHQLYSCVYSDYKISPDDTNPIIPEHCIILFDTIKEANEAIADRLDQNRYFNEHYVVKVPLVINTPSLEPIESAFDVNAVPLPNEITTNVIFE